MPTFYQQHMKKPRRTASISSFHRSLRPKDQMDNNGKVLKKLYDKAGDIHRWYLKRMLYLPRKASERKSLSAAIENLICIISLKNS